MIYFDGLDSVIESIYLDESLGERIPDCDVFVNPINTKYIVSKVIIISNPNYPESSLEILKNNNCKILGRVKLGDLYEFHPYILGINQKIQWNGKVLSEFTDFQDIVDSGDCSFESGILYFPKYSIIPNEALDAFGNLTSLGWALQQVGSNVKIDTPFKNLDLLKTKKLIP